MKNEADAVYEAVNSVLDNGYRTIDIMQPEMKTVGTEMMGNLVAERILSNMGVRK
jgi:isocitrate/isopropylmalate dehydrogenase